MVATDTYVDRIRAIARRIKDPFTLCMFMGKTEREVMVAQTIHASVVNMDKRGEPYSVRGSNVYANHGNGLVENRQSYAWLLEQDYFIEETRGADVVIFATEKLLGELEKFLKIPAPIL